MKPALFVDRDGVLIKNRVDYVRTLDQVEIYPGALESLSRAGRDYRVVIVTNQSGVGRGLIDLEDAEAINRHLVIEAQKAGSHIDAVCMCIHSPEQECNCRKPKPGLVLQAVNMLGIDLPNSVMIGDALSDLEAGRAAGVGKVALVRTGRGRDQEKQLATNGGETPLIFEDLPSALNELI